MAASAGVMHHGSRAEHMTKILDFIPPPFLRRELEVGLARAIGRPFDRWRNFVNNRLRYVDPDGAPVEWVEWLLNLLGFEDIGGLSEQRKRNLLDAAMDVWRDKWRADGVSAYIKALAGIPSHFVDWNTDSFIAGVSLAGDICGPGQVAYVFSIRRPEDVIDNDELQERLRLVLPAFAHYRICDTGGQNCTAWGSP